MTNSGKHPTATTANSIAAQPPERFTPLFNDAFLQIFGNPDSGPAVLPLLNALLRAVGIEEIENVDKITADTALPGGVECKTPRLDVVVMCDGSRLFDLESERRKVNVGNKSMFYAAKLLSQNISKGGRRDYAHIPQVITVVLLEGSMVLPDEEQFISVCRMKWEAGERTLDGPDGITLVVAELDKVTKRYNNGDLAEILKDESLAWLYLLAAGYKDPKEAERIVSSFPTMEEFAKRYNLALGDPETSRAYEKYWESELEYNSAINQAVRDGREQGLAHNIATLRAAGMNDAADLLERAQEQ